MRWVLVLLAGCLPEPIDNAVVVQGRHVTVHADPAIPICEEAVAAADRYVEDLAALIDVPPPAIDYYLFDGPPGCGSGVNATASCEIGGSVYANAWIHFHEIAHAVDDTRPPALFVEGFAEAMSWPVATAREQRPAAADVALPFESTAFRTGDVLEHYRMAGAFVRYLIDRYGIDRYHAFSASLISLSDELTITRAFERAYSVSLTDAVAGWRAADPGSSRLRLPIDLTDCGDVMPPVGDDTWQLDVMPPSTCTSGVTANGTAYAQYPHRYGFEVERSGLFAIELATREPANLALRSCADGTRQAFTTPAAYTPTIIVPVSAGRHALDVPSDADGWRFQRLGAPTRECEAAPVFRPPAGDGWRVAIHGERGTWIRIEPSSKRLFVVPVTHVTVCEGSCSRSRCATVTEVRAFDRPSAQPLYIRLGATPAQGPSVIVRTTSWP